MPKPLPWSHTSLDDFTNCPRAYHAKRVAKTIVEPETEAMLWGKYVHKAFEDRQNDQTPLPCDLQSHEDYMQKLESKPGFHFCEQKIALDRKTKPTHFFDREVWYRGVIDYLKGSVR